MSKTAMVILTVLLVLASCFISGCSSLPFSGPPPSESPKKINVGLSGTDRTQQIQKYNFENCILGISSDDLFPVGEETPANASREMHIKSVRGTDLDENGDAGSWAFTAEHGNQISIITYNRQGRFVINAQGTINRTDIIPSEIISPRELLEKNHASIFNAAGPGTTGTMDISLSEGYYSLTISGNGTPHTMIFDAKTGVLRS
jgi:hypothetical protein